MAAVSTPSTRRLLGGAAERYAATVQRLLGSRAAAGRGGSRWEKPRRLTEPSVHDDLRALAYG